MLADRQDCAAAEAARHTFCLGYIFPGESLASICSHTGPSPIYSLCCVAGASGWRQHLVLLVKGGMIPSARRRWTPVPKIAVFGARFEGRGLVVFCHDFNHPWQEVGSGGNPCREKDKSWERCCKLLRSWLGNSPSPRRDDGHSQLLCARRAGLAAPPLSRSLRHRELLIIGPKFLRARWRRDSPHNARRCLARLCADGFVSGGDPGAYILA